MQKIPYQVQFKFRTLQSKSKKKSFACLIKIHFFLQIWAPFGETIPKRYNTWGLESYIIIWQGGWWVGGGWVWPG